MTSNDHASAVRRANDDDLDAVVDVLVDSHVEYAWERWALACRDSRDRRERLTGLYRAELRSLALRAGEVWITDCGRSVAVWLPARFQVELDPADAAAREVAAVAAFGERLSVVAEIDGAVACHRPVCDWYLATMGTLRRAQRLGLGTEVLQPRLRALDDTAASAVLETSDPANLRFYGRLGFEVVAELDRLAHGAPTTWVMERLHRHRGDVAG